MMANEPDDTTLPPARISQESTEHLALINALNLLCDYVSKHLPDGWEIRLLMCNAESTIELIDPIGNEIQTEPPDYGVSVLDVLCDRACEIEGEK